MEWTRSNEREGETVERKEKGWGMVMNGESGKKAMEMGQECEGGRGMEMKGKVKGKDRVRERKGNEV